MSMLREVLEDIGLTSNEVKVYVTLLQLGSAPASDIIHKSGLHRSNVYDMLEQLKEKGLILQVSSGKKNVFEAANPQRLKEILKAKEERLDAIMPELANITKSTPNFTVRVLKGKEGMMTVLNEIIQAKPDEVLVLGVGGEEYTLIPAAIDQFHKKRIQHKIKNREIYRDNPPARQRGSILSAMPYSEVRYLPKQVDEPSHIDIYNNRVTLFSMVPECTAVITIIESKQLATSFREYFELLWQMSKE